MHSPKRMLLVVMLVAFGVFLALGAYLAVGAYRWFSDLPNRVVISGEEFGQAIVVTTEIALREGPQQARLDTIKVLAEVGADAAPFLPVLGELTSDPDAVISAAATDAIARIHNSRGSKR
jgi:hypothetical protein